MANISKTAIAGMASTIWSDRDEAIADALAVYTTAIETAWKDYDADLTTAYDAEESTRIDADYDLAVAYLEADAIRALRLAQAELDRATDEGDAELSLIGAGGIDFSNLLPTIGNRTPGVSSHFECPEEPLDPHTPPALPPNNNNSNGEVQGPDLAPLTGSIL